MKNTKAFLVFVVLLIAGSISAYAGGLFDSNANKTGQTQSTAQTQTTTTAQQSPEPAQTQTQTPAQVGGTSSFVTKDGEVWAGETRDGITYGLVFQSDGKVFDVVKMDGTWTSQRQNGTWRGNTWGNWTLSVTGSTLTCSYSYTNDEGEKRTSTDTYTKETGQEITMYH